MKILALTLSLVLYLSADEMQRIEAIVNDITKLRGEYAECQSELSKYSAESKISSNMIVVDICEKENANNKRSQKLLKNQIEANTILSTKCELLEKKYKEILKTKDIEIKDLKNKINSKKIKTTKVCKEFENPNEFPKLMMKEEFKEKVLKEKKVQKYEIETFKPASFILKKDSSIYDSADGKELYKWTEGTTFTSNKKVGDWIKITGTFVDGKWKKSRKSMWIKENLITKK